MFGQHRRKPEDTLTAINAAKEGTFFTQSRPKSEPRPFIFSTHIRKLLSTDTFFSYQIPRKRLLGTTADFPSCSTAGFRSGRSLWRDNNTIAQWQAPNWTCCQGKKEKGYLTILYRSVGGPVWGFAVQNDNGCWRTQSEIIGHLWFLCPWGEHEEVDKYHWDQQAAPLLPPSCRHTCVHTNHPQSRCSKADGKKKGTEKHRPMAGGW